VRGDRACIGSDSIYSSRASYEAVGDFGWFYGDFFISGDAYTQHLCYTGIYRFLNNPDCVTGYAGLYGLALMTRSWTVFGLAVMSHLMNVLFLNLVEIPHMNTLYQSRIRKESPLPRVIKEKVPDKLKQRLEDRFRQEAKNLRRVQVAAIKQVFEFYKKIEDAVQHENEHVQQPVKLRVPEKATLGEPLIVEFETTKDHADTDWVGIYAVDISRSMPGLSDGKWMYVPPGASGKLVFPPALLPQYEGVFHVRYHLNNTYEEAAIARRVIMFSQPASSLQNSESQGDLTALSEADAKSVDSKPVGQ